MRSPYQILVLPFLKRNGEYRYALFKREDLQVWQGIAGGGEEGENPLISAQREAFEEAGVSRDSNFLRLASMTTIPVTKINGFKWGKKIAVIPEFSFGVEITASELKITSQEHTEFGWFSFEEAMEKLQWDSNKTALWELHFRLLEGNTQDVSENISEYKSLI